MKDLVNICGSGSSGSTLLSFLLDRHPDIVCGDELGLFSKPLFYDKFNTVKCFSRLIKHIGLPSNPYFQDRSVLRNLDSYYLEKKHVWGWVKSSSNMRELASKIKKQILANTGKTVWAEKTPENIFLIQRFMRVFPDAKVIHLVRDPRDVVISLMKRKHSLETAVSIWLASVACIQPLRATNKNLLEIRYEDLVEDHQLTMKKICRFLALPYHVDFFSEDSPQSSGIAKTKGLASWGADPSRKISNDSVGSYRAFEKISSRILYVRLTRAFSRMIGTPPYSVSDLMRVYEYAHSSEPSKPNNGIEYQHYHPASKVIQVLDAVMGSPKPLKRIEI